MERLISVALAAAVAACGGNEAAEEPASNVAAAPAEIDVLPPDESVATPTDELGNGVTEAPDGENAAGAE